MTAKVRITRKGSGAMPLSPYRIVIDGEVAGSVEHHETVELPIEVGSHTIRIRLGRVTSPERSFVVRDGAVVSFWCHGTSLLPVFIAGLIKPGLGIKLQQDFDKS